MWREIQLRFVSRLLIALTGGGCRRFLAADMVVVLLTAVAGPVRADISFTGDVSMNGSFVEIGNVGVGSFVIDEGSTLFSSNVEIGQQGIGFAEVNGLGSFWDIDNATIGINGFGQLDIRDRGHVDVQSQFRLGSSPFGDGRVSVEGLGTVLRIGSLYVGDNGAGTLKILDEAIVEVVQSSMEVGTRGTLELQHGLLRTDYLDNFGLIHGSGQIVIQQGGAIQNYGRIEAYEGDLLTIGGAFIDDIQNRRTIAVDGGEINFQLIVANDSFGADDKAEITLRNGILRSTLVFGDSPNLLNNGVLAAIGGLNDVYGRVENNPDGDIAVTNDSILVFHDDVEANGGVISVFPGSSAIFLEDLTMSGPAVLLAQLAGTEENGYGTAEIVGTAQLNAELQVALSAGYSPELGDTFPLLTAAGGINGLFELGDSPPLPDGLQWNLDVGANQVLLSVVPETLTGDYDGDGRVSAADFTVWRDSFGASDLLNRDPHNGGPVGEDDFNSWMTNYGNTLEDIGTGFASGSAAVPEPGTLVMLLLAGFVASRFSRRCFADRK